MQTQIKSSNGITLVPIETRLLTSRKIFVEGEIDHAAACSFVRKILLLCVEDNRAPIDILINSPGGEINSGLLMYDVIQTCPAPIRMFCIGQAYSMGAILLACGNHGRYMLPHSELMLHEPLLGHHVGGNSSSIHSISESLLEIKRKMNLILAKHTGKPEKEIETATGYNHYFSPEESISFGLCDKIVGIDAVMTGGMDA